MIIVFSQEEENQQYCRTKRNPNTIWEHSTGQQWWAWVDRQVYQHPGFDIRYIMKTQKFGWSLARIYRTYRYNTAQPFQKSFEAKFMVPSEHILIGRLACLTFGLIDCGYFHTFYLADVTCWILITVAFKNHCKINQVITNSWFK